MTEHIPESPHSTTTAGPTRVFDDETSRDDGLRRIFFLFIVSRRAPVETPPRPVRNNRQT